MKGQPGECRGRHRKKFTAGEKINARTGVFFFCREKSGFHGEAPLKSGFLVYGAETKSQTDEALGLEVRRREEENSLTLFFGEIIFRGISMERLS